MMPSSSSSLFDSLCYREPTPPKDVNEQVQAAAYFLEHGHDETECDAITNMKGVAYTDTPPASSPTVSSQEPRGGSTASKKVNFAAETTYHEVPRFGISSSPGDRKRRAYPRTTPPRHPKSILRPTNPSPLLATDGNDSRDNSSIGKMLPSILQALASGARSSRLDAYMTLTGALKNCENVPDRQLMAPRMGQLQQYISRDMRAKDSDGKLGTQLATQAMSLVSQILPDDALSKAMDDQFRAFLVEESITVLEQPDVPKTLFKAHLVLVAYQRFDHVVMTESRITRILSLLRTVEDRCTGNSPAAGRVVIYQRLLEQSPMVMNTKARDWLEHVFHGMLSSSKELRQRSVEACTYAGIVLGTKPATCKALQQLLDTEISEEQVYFDYLRSQLLALTKDESASSWVPRIWSAVILFFRSKQRSLESWPKIRAWLEVLQQCLNAGDLTVKYYANLAWHRLAFVVMPDSSTSRQMRAILKVPIMTALARPAKEKNNKHTRQMAMDNYNNLIHYALRPSLSHVDLDIAWDEFAEPVLLEMVTAGTGGRRFACKVLHGLLTSSAGAWNEKAALEAAPIKPEELPRLDARWVRSRMAKVLKVVEPLLTGLLRSPEGCSATIGTWSEVLQAIADAGAQEVRTSNELREAIALIMNLFRRLWEPCSTSESQPNTLDTRLDTFQKLLQKTCQYVGPSLLSEDILARTPQGDAQAAPTPSHRASKHQSALQSPLVFITTMLCHSERSHDQTQWHDIIKETLGLACESKTTSAAKVHLLAKSLQTLSLACSEERASRRAQSIWPLFASLTRDALMLSHVETGGNGVLGQQMRDAVSVLVGGVSTKHTTADDGAIALDLLKEMVRVAKSQAGDAGIVLSVSEPLAKLLTEKESSTQPIVLLTSTSAVLRAAPWPQSRQAMDQARKALWTSTVGSYQARVFDPYEHVYRLIYQSSQCAYPLCATESPAQVHAADYVDALKSFLSTCPDFATANTLRHMQAGVEIWLQDNDRLVFGSGQSFRTKVGALWRVCLARMSSVLRKDSGVLHVLHPLIVAALVSPDRNIVNDTILSWNKTFGEQENLVYPAKLEQVLRALQPHVELNLPGFPPRATSSIDVALPAFEQSEQDASASFSSRWSGLPRGTASPVKLLAPTSVDRSSHLHTFDTISSAKSGSTASTRPTPKARLRHDDSQVQFAPIESSPLRQEFASQLLTDRQKEVKERQEQDAQMFPDLSSSPAKPKQITRKLDFAPHLSRPGGEETVGTPLELPDGHAEMSDYLGSSPTPHSSDKTAIQDNHAHSEENEEQTEPPSSPPQSSQLKYSFVANSAEPEQDSNENYMTAQQSDHIDNAEVAHESGLLNSDLPSDTALPAEQLLHEAELAVDRTNLDDDNDPEVDQVDATTVVDATEMPDATEDNPEAVSELPPQEKNDQSEQGDLETSRIEDSMMETKSPAATSEAADQEGLRSTTRKRKRGSGATGNSTSKRRKAQSPLKRFVSGISGYFGGNQNADDETDDEIVVASSQPTYSPATRRHEQLDADTEPKSSSQPPTAVKRGRGRPRKSETPTPAVPATAVASTKRLKRKASALSDANTTELDITTVKETPALAKTRKQRRSQNGKTVTELSTESGTTDARPPSRSRVATEVAIEPSDTPGSLSRTRMADSDDDGPATTPQKQLEDETAASVQERPIATPRGILARLKDALADYKTMILGPSEEREHDDVLFALRTEMHEAGRRGRQA